MGLLGPTSASISQAMQSHVHQTARAILPLLLSIANPQFQEGIVVIIALSRDLLSCPIVQLKHGKCLSLVMLL